jgi:hypothetical protein
LVQSTTLWTPSVSIADEPVIAAATNFDTAIPRFAASAMTSVRVLAVGELSERGYCRSPASAIRPPSEINSRRLA